jgi:hypothetical protein
MRSTERWHKFVRSCLLLVSTKERVPNGNRREQRAPIVWRESKGTSEGSLLVLAGDTFTQSNRNIQMLKVGINYRFNWSNYTY